MRTGRRRRGGKADGPRTGFGLLAGRWRPGCQLEPHMVLQVDPRTTDQPAGFRRRPSSPPSCSAFLHECCRTHALRVGSPVKPVDRVWASHTARNNIIERRQRFRRPRRLGLMGAITATLTSFTSFSPKIPWARLRPRPISPTPGNRRPPRAGSRGGASETPAPRSPQPALAAPHSLLRSPPRTRPAQPPTPR